ncbi:MAG: ribonuclease J [Proteobacteria bacterium]|nr:ribonuclease J [Pseudomonadota bacterium]
MADWPGESSDLLFVPLGGSSEIGMNLNLYGLLGKWLMVDFGTSFAGETLPGIDLIFPDLSFIEKRKRNLLGLVLTHGHEDHIGAIAHLWPKLKCPVYATPFTAELVREKLKEEDLLEQVELNIIQDGKPFSLGSFEIRYIPLAHSIPEGHALEITTPRGVIFHTGDWKLDPDSTVAGPASEAALRTIGKKGVLAMIGDSTNVFNKEASPPEQSIKPNLQKLVAEQKGRVVITTFASNVERVETVGEIAEATGRHLVTIGRSMKRIIGAAKKCGYLKNFPPILKEEDGGYLPRDKVLILCTGCQGEIRAALNGLAGDVNKKIHLSAGDTVLFSSKMIPGNELPIGRLINKLVARGIKVITEKDADIHVSGHPGEPELVKMYDWIRPRIAIPVHGEPRHIHAHAELAEKLQVGHVFRPKNGTLIRLAPGPPEIIGEVETGYLALDGKRLLSLASNTLSERRRMMENGVLAITVTFDRGGKLAGRPVIQPFGILCSANDVQLKLDLYDLIMAEISTWAPRDETHARFLEEELRLAVLRLFRHETGKRPLISVTVTGLEKG